MNNLLLMFAVLSLGAVAVATYVFTVAARNYVSDSSDDEELSLDDSDLELGGRSGHDRRQSNNVIDFPIQLPGGDIVYRDRRIGERRSAG